MDAVPVSERIYPLQLEINPLLIILMKKFNEKFGFTIERTLMIVVLDWIVPRSKSKEEVAEEKSFLSFQRSTSIFILPEVDCLAFHPFIAIFR